MEDKMNKKIMSIYGGHNATVVFRDDAGTYRIIELERLMKQRYYMLFDKSEEEFISVMKSVLSIAKEHWGIENDFDVCAYGKNGATHLHSIRKVVNTKEIKQFDHHLSHAACAYYQSPRPLSPTVVLDVAFDREPVDLVISFDGGGNDGVFNVYTTNRREINPKPVFTSDLNLGHAYMLTGYPIKELKGQKGGLPHDLALAGKMMGLVAYGSVRQEWLPAMLEFYRSTGEWSLERLGNKIGLPLGINTIKGQVSYDFAATSQRAFEILAEELVLKVNAFDPDFICLSGGCALNVLFNERLARKHGWGNDFLFIPPNSDDGGLALGQHFLVDPPTKQVDVAYNGLPILDKGEFQQYLTNRKHKKISYQQLAAYIRKGKIVGIIGGDSEVGPRALGNRSIICDPRIFGMKDTLNSKVKFREWFRPFAPVARDKDADEYFVLNQKNLDNHRFMSFAPMVREEYRLQLTEVTHNDNTSRLQTVPNDGDHIFTHLLNAFERLDEDKPSVLLNTSFNIKGFPILSTYNDAFKVLDETELDAVYIDGYLFEKMSTQ